VSRLLAHTGVKLLHFFTRPRRSPQELQAGLDRRVVDEAVDGDAACQLCPAKVRDQIVEHLLQRDAVMHIFVSRRVHGQVPSLY